MYILTVSKEDFPETRVVVGCVDMAQQTQSALELRGYQVISSQGDSPQRPKEEQRRASQLLARIFGN